MFACLTVSGLLNEIFLMKIKKKKTFFISFFPKKNFFNFINVNSFIPWHFVCLLVVVVFVVFHIKCLRFRFHLPIRNTKKKKKSKRNRVIFILFSGHSAKGQTIAWTVWCVLFCFVLFWFVFVELLRKTTGFHIFFVAAYLFVLGSRLVRQFLFFSFLLFFIVSLCLGPANLLFLCYVIA